jgi:hypothetical protein
MLEISEGALENTLTTPLGSKFDAARPGVVHVTVRNKVYVFINGIPLESLH